MDLVNLVSLTVITGAGLMLFGLMIVDWDDPRSKARSALFLMVGALLTGISQFGFDADKYLTLPLFLFFLGVAIFFFNEWRVARKDMLKK